MLSTIDNPYNPFDDYDHWLQYDREKGYFTNEYLARVMVSSPDLSDTSQEEDVAEAMDSIINIDPLGIYIKVNKDYIPNTERFNNLVDA
jgi:hypothetical protein